VAAIFQHKGEAAAAEKAYQRIKDEKNVPAALREEALYRLGEARFSREEYKQAVELYELLLTEFPEGVFAREVRKRRAWACFCLKDYARAVELATEWRSRYGDVSDYEMDYVFGASLVGKELYADAVPLFERLAASARAPDEYRRLARYHQSYCLLRLDRYAAVVEAGTSFLKDYPQGPGHADVRYFLGEACFGLKDYKRAADELNRATQEAGGQWPYLMSASLRLTESLEKAGDLKAAAAVNRRLADDKQVSERAFFLLKAGECERTAGDGDAAVRDFERLLAEYPQAGEVRTAVLHLGELYAERKDYGRAEQLIGDLLSRHQQTEGKGKAKLLFFLGYLCFQQSKFAEAEESLRAALAAGGGPEVSQDARYYLGGTLIELHREDEALDLFAEFLALPEAERPVFSDSLLSRLDALYFARNRYDVSESINRWLMAWKDPEVVDRASLRLAQILVAQSRLPDARALLEGLLARKEAASATDPNCGEILSLLGEVLMSAGQNDPAVSMFERSLKVPGLSVEGAARSRWGLGEILRKESRLNQALHHAVNAFVLCDDPTYTPRAMLLAIGILAETGRTEQAQTTCRELQVRFPSFYEQRRGDPLIQKLGTDAPAAPKQP
jgi:tetratricopeptide (TPR) repeat protein